jgi:truncated hemoglobin YjbI
MTSKEFVIWLKGFVAAANEYNITPKQYDAIVEKLKEVNDSGPQWNSTRTSTLFNGTWDTDSTKTVING